MKSKKDNNVSFSHQIKLELLKNKMDPSEIIELLKGVIFANSHFQEEENIIFRINDFEVSQHLRFLLNKLKIKSFLIPKHKNWIMINKDQKLLEKVILEPMYFFAGVFIGSGSIASLNTSSYHLQIETWYKNIHDLMQQKLKKHFNFLTIKRNQKYTLYLKKSESIGDFLNSIGASKAFFSFIDEKIMRDINNNYNRQSSLDVYNQKRLVDSTSYHLENFDLIKKYRLEYLFSEMELDFFKLKKENPYSSLSELVVLLEKKKGVKKTKSALNHWLRKLKKHTENLI
ncbi:DNA-binding protein WhiA [Mycoplasma iguanae]|uniref:DNA-binding protein WhiA n=1 Tax=Mycoplasma iguanae TaxID=292461 RepID=A0ABY5RA18_9MOLU|nr:DNA-binding protein WhiA [Mycoplasma iguanae]UVD81607.1 DNA-binding protein WhiA [Mycoplasma iguanae]